MGQEKGGKAKTVPTLLQSFLTREAFRMIVNGFGDKFKPGFALLCSIIEIGNDVANSI